MSLSHPGNRRLAATEMIAAAVAFAGADSRWSRRQLRRRLLRWTAPALLVVLGCGMSWATFSLTFQGLVQTLNTGGSIALNSPAGIAVDAAGDVFVTDTNNNRIVEVTVQGVASVLTITGLSPSLSFPTAITTDGSGDLYVVDTGNNRVVEITAAGAGSAISTGSVTLSSPSGVALDQAGDIFISDTGNNRIVEVTSGGTAAALTITVSSGSATLSIPRGLGVNTSGALYIADSGHNRIVKVASGSTTGVVQSILGGVILSNPTAVTVDRMGNVFIADTGNNRIAQIDTSSNGTVLYTGSVTLNGPVGVALDAFGTAYIADTGNSRGLVVDSPVNGDLVVGDPTYSLNRTAVGFGHIPLGSSSAVTLTLQFTTGATALGSVQVLTAGVPSLDFTSGSSTTCNGSTGTSTSCSVEVSFLPTAPGLRTGSVVLFDGATPPNAILTTPLYGWGDSPIAALSPNTGTVISTGGLALSNPYQVALDGSGNIYVGDYTSKNVTKIPAGGGSATLVALGSPGSIAVQNITGVAVDEAGNLFIGDHENSRILVVTPSGVVSVLSITGLSPSLGFPVALAFDGAGNLYIADFTNGRVVRVSTLVVDGSSSTGLGTAIGTGSFTFTGSTLTGMTVDSQGNIYTAARSQNSSSIIKVTNAGVASELSFPGITPAISNPQGVGVDAMGNVYVVDTGNSRIVKLTTAGVASAVSISGLSAPSTLSSLLFGVTSDALGNLYIPDWTNNRIVFVNVSGSVLSFASTNVGSTSSDSPKTATVTNLGNQPLVFSANPAFTANFSQPTGSTNQCLSSTSLTVGLACNVSVQFTPQSAGSLSAGITVTNNTLNVPSSTQQISVSGTGIQTADATLTAVVVTPTSAGIGQPITITATVSDTTSGHTATIPTGSVTFMDTVGSTSISLNGGAAVTLSGGLAVLTGVTLSGAGTHTITANYGGVTNSFLTSSGTATLTVSKDSGTMAGPATQPVQLSVGQAGSVLITITGPYSAVAVPSGSLSYTILNSSNISVASGTATLTAGSGSSTGTVPLASTLAAGTYTVSITYSGDANYAASSTPTTVEVTVGQITPSIHWTPAAGTITYGNTLISVLVASASNGGSSVPGTFTYTATLAGGSPVAVTSGTVLNAGTYVLTVTFTPTDSTTYKSTTATLSLTVAQAAPAVALASSGTTVLATNPVTFTATVSASAGTPTGSVSFLDGTTSLGSVALKAGVAAFSTSSLAVGAHTITAHYAGDTNFSAITSTAVTETVQDFSLTVAASGTTSATVTPGGVANYALVIGPTTGTTFPGPVTLSVSGLPTGATGTITPKTLPAGSGSTNVTLTVQLPSVTASLRHHETLALQLSPMMLGMLLLPFAGKIRRAARKQGPLALLLLATLGTTLLALSGCGSKNTGFLGNPQTSYVLTVTATSGNLSHSTTLNLMVQ